MKKVRSIFIMTMIASMFLTSCSKKAEVATETTSMDTVTIRTATVKVQTIEEDFEYSALVRAEALNNIAPTVLKLMNLNIPTEMDEPLI